MAETQKRGMQDKLIGILVLALLVAVGGLGYMYGQLKVLGSVKNTTGSDTTAAGQQQAAAQPQVSVTDDQIKALFSDKDLVTFGDANRKMLFVEVSDPSCPYCHIAGGEDPELNKQAGANFVMAVDGGSYVPPVPEMRRLVDAGKASFAFVYYPGHGNGELATKAMFCAQDEGKFWQAHDKLMSDAGYGLINDKVKNDIANAQQLVDFLSDVTNAGQMKSCLESDKYADRLQANMAVASKLGVSGTPGFFVNTIPFSGAYSYADMKAAVEKVLGES